MSTQIRNLTCGTVFDPVAQAFMMVNVLKKQSKEVISRECRHIWNVRDYLRCPIIGTCLSTAEQKQILKKGGSFSSSTTEYEIHSLLVAAAATKNRVSVMIETSLNRKYRAQLARYFHLTQDELLKTWEDMFQSGDYGALFWFVCGMPNVPEHIINRVFGDVHMQMHAVSRQSGHDRQAIVRAKQETERLRQHIQKLKAAYREESKARQSNEKECTAMRNKCFLLEKERQSLIEKTMLPSLVQDELNALKHENTSLFEEIAGLTESLRFMQKAYDVLEAENRTLRENPIFCEDSALHKPEVPPSDGCPAGKQCTACNLCRCRVLIVGGMTKMEVYYRKAVETCGGAFEYHDGYMQGGGISALDDKQ